MLNLNDITLVAVATQETEAAYKALKYSSKDINFGRVLLMSNEIKIQDKKIDQIKIDQFSSVGDWGKFIVFKLHKFIDTKYIILVHADGFIVNPNSWDPQFLNYDYIGAPFPIPKDNKTYSDFQGNIIRVGNSVSLRSKKILEMPSKMNLGWEDYDKNNLHEDGYLSVHIRHILEKEGIKFGPFDLACKFSRESIFKENKNIEPFAFHKWKGPNNKYPSFSKKNSFAYKILKKIKSIVSR